MGWQDATPSDDVEAAGWISSRLHQFGQGDVGSVVPTGFSAYVRVDQNASLASILSNHTTTPDRCWLCLWDGYGYLHPGGSAEYVFWMTDRFGLWRLRRSMWRWRARLPSLRLPRRKTVPAPHVRVRLPNRDYLLFTGPVAKGDGWDDGPNLWWPEDRAWCVASEIDLDYALVGGSIGLCDELRRQTGATPVGLDDAI